MSKFEKLTKYLKNTNKDTVKMSFEDIESIVGFSLPNSAYKHRAYFANVLDHSISKAWIEAGYRSSNVNIYDKTVEFIKEGCFTKALLSSYIFTNISKYKERLKDNNYISGIAFCESVFLYGLDFNAACSLLKKYNISLVDDELKRLDITSPYLSLNNSKTYCLNIYNSFIKIILFKCLLSLFSKKDDRQRIFDSFMENDELVFDFTYSLKNDIGLRMFDYKLRSIIELIGLNMDASNIISSIGNLDYENIDNSILSNLTFMQDNYLNAACKTFIENCKKNEPFVPIDYVSELLNIMVLSKNEKLIYLTSCSINNKVLFGKILERITLVDKKGANYEDSI